MNVCVGFQGRIILLSLISNEGRLNSRMQRIITIVMILPLFLLIVGNDQSIRHILRLITMFRGEIFFWVNNALRRIVRIDVDRSFDDVKLFHVSNDITAVTCSVATRRASVDFHQSTVRRVNVLRRLGEKTELLISTPPSAIGEFKGDWTAVGNSALTMCLEAEHRCRFTVEVASGWWWTTDVDDDDLFDWFGKSFELPDSSSLWTFEPCSSMEGNETRSDSTVIDRTRTIELPSLPSSLEATVSKWMNDNDWYPTDGTLLFNVFCFRMATRLRVLGSSVEYLWTIFGKNACLRDWCL